MVKYVLLLTSTTPAWAGYWRGTNGTDQSSICAPSFTQRWPLDALCMRGWTVAGSPYNQFWASDLHHRLFHTAKIGEGLVDHYADDYGPSLQLAVDAPREAVRNSHSLAFFALDVYAFDVAAPDQGCTGTYVADGGGGAAEVESSSSSSSFMAMSTSSAPPAAIAAAATTTADELPTSTRSSDSSCHTHADGEIHCA